MDNSAYRNPLEGARLRLHAGLNLERRDLDPLRQATPVIAARVARIAAGAVLVTFALALMVLTALALKRGQWIDSLSWRLQRTTGVGLLTLLLIAAWPAAALAYGAAYALCRAHGGGAGRRWQRYLDRAHAATLSDDIFKALARLEAVASPVTKLRARIARIEMASVAMPLIGLSLLTPLTLHLIFVTLVAGHGCSGCSMGTVLPRHLADMHDWIKTSLVVVGHAHLALAARGFQFARRLRTDTPDALRGWGWRALGTAVIVSAIPGVLFLAVPPLLVAVTGLVFIPAMFHGILTLVVRERAVQTQTSVAQAWANPGEAASPASPSSPVTP